MEHVRFWESNHVHVTVILTLKGVLPKLNGLFFQTVVKLNTLLKIKNNVTLYINNYFDGTKFSEFFFEWYSIFITLWGVSKKVLKILILIELRWWIGTVIFIISKDILRSVHRRFLDFHLYWKVEIAIRPHFWSLFPILNFYQ